MNRFVTALLLMLATTVHADERAIVKEVVVKATPEVVWRTWTTAEGIKSFFAPDARVEPRPDGPFEIYFNPYAAPGLRGADEMRFMALQEPRFLSFTWNAPPHLPDARKQRTLVTLRFTPAANGETRIVLHHSGWGDGGQWDQTFEYFNSAWGRVLANLKKRFDEGPIDWSEWTARLKADAEKK